MAFKNKLLATAAIPLIALMGMGPASAASLPRVAASFEAKSDVITVQSDDEELLKQQQKQQRRENRKNKNNQDSNASGQDDGNTQRRNKQNDAAGQQDNTDEVQPRRKKNNAAQQDNAGQMQQQDDQETVKPRRKKNADAEQQQQDNAGQMQQQDDQETVKPRRKKNADAEQQQQDNAGQMQQQDDQETVKPRRKKNADAEQQQDNAGQNGPSDEDVRKALENNNNKKSGKRDKQNDAGNDNGAVEQDNSDTGNRQRQKDRQKNAADQSDDNGANNNKQADQADENKPRDKVRDKARADNPEQVKKNKQIAEDPSKTTDTVVLPVENGAAVLDSDKDADNRGDKSARERRKREREDVKQVKVPKSDKDAQAGFKEDKPIRLKPVLDKKGERFDFKGYDDVGGRRVDKRDNDTRVIINIDGRIVIRGDDDNRISRRGDSHYERLPEGRIREIVIRPNGDKIVTVRNRWGEIIRRSRVERGGREVVIFFSPDLNSGRDRLFMRDAGDDLPPMRLRIPVRDYIVDVSSDSNRDYEEFLDQPPVEPVERVYSVDEVKYSARIRDKMRRIDLDTITFETGSAEISMDQASSLKKVGAAIRDLIDRDPGETFMIEGHTDAVGSDESNLVLSDSRADSVANVLSDLFEIPSENLVTQGYGERFLKVDTDAPERANRRVTIRRITPLVRPAASVEE